ncbi:MAG: HAMP domain-containing protein, partial [Desulfobacterales bacterium]|nr:HAMP domain-containing protein [Desulfobacterales bacterium]
MFSDKLRRLPRTLAFRLTLWYAGRFTISSCAAFFLFYLLIVAYIQERNDQELLSQAGSLSTLLAVKGVDAVKRVAILEAQAAGVKKIFFRLLYPSGDVFSSSNMSYWQDIGVGREAVAKLVGEQTRVFETIRIPGRKTRVRILYDVIGPGIILQLGQAMETHARFIEAFQRIFVLTMAVLILLAGGIGWFMARRALSGVADVTRTARHISDGALDKRVPQASRAEEIDQLAATFNHMLDRIQGLIGGMREMSDNIAHDLKSPLTRIRGLAEVTLTTAESLDDYQSMAANTIEECDHLLDMINTMLAISKAEAGVETLDLSEMDLAAVVRDACELFQPSAEDKLLSLVCEAPRPCPLHGDVAKIRRMIANLLDNALKYTPPGGTVRVAVNGGGAPEAILDVQDTG